MTDTFSVLAAVGLAVIAVASCGSSSSSTTTAPAAATATQDAGCSPAGNLNFVCGLEAPEDLVLLPSTSFLVASGMEPGSGLHLIDTRTKSAQSLTFVARPDAVRFAGCPGPLDPAAAVLHGLSLRPAEGSHHTLYATNHGGRESVEVFDLDTQGTTPSLTWIGCVVMPDMLPANSVAAFSDGALVATVLMMPGTGFDDVFAGRNTGAVFMWTPGTAGFRLLPGTELSGNNGIDTSPDDREFYVASSGLKRIVAYSRSNPTKALRYAQLAEFAPDNVRWMNGQLVTAGMIDAEPACGGAPKKPEDIRCPRGYVAAAVDPQSMKVTEIARGPAAAPYGGTATAIQVGDDLWLSSFSADRLAWRSLRQ